MTESEREEKKKEELQEWMEAKLDILIRHAYFDREFAKKLCEKISYLARGDRELVNIIKRYAVSGSGRHPLAPNSSDFKFMLIHYYAHHFQESIHETYAERSKAAINELISDYEKFTGRRVKYASMRNILGDAIKSEDVSKYTDWVQDAIKQRIKRRIPRKKT